MSTALEAIKRVAAALAGGKTLTESDADDLIADTGTASYLAVAS